jgi:hypothetical protein
MRLLTTFVIGRLPWFEHLLPSFRRYASSSGADFQEVKWFPEMGTEFHGNPNWSCVAFLKRFARQDYYSDVLFLPSCPNLFDFPGDLVCVPDAAWPLKDDRYWSWVERNYPQSCELKAEGSYFNAGVLLFRLDAVRKMNLEGPYPDDYPNDQDYLNMRVGEAKLDITWIGPEYNQRQVWDRHSALVNNHVLHFVGRSKDQVPAYTRFLFEQSV